MAMVETLEKKQVSQEKQEGKFDHPTHHISFSHHVHEHDGSIQVTGSGLRRSADQVFSVFMGEGKRLDVRAIRDPAGHVDVFRRDLTTNAQTPGVEQLGEDFYLPHGRVMKGEHLGLQYDRPGAKAAEVVVSLVPEPPLKSQD
jgi:hypothetical protein